METGITQNQQATQATALTLAKINEARVFLAEVKEIPNCRKLLAMAKGFVIAARNEYKAAKTIKESKDDKEAALDTAINAGELRLLAEARLGELLKEQIRHDGGRPLKNTDNDVSVFLKAYGITQKDSSRAQGLADHQDLIPEVIEKAKRVGDIPTRKGLEFLIRSIPKTPAPPPSELPITPDNNILDKDFHILEDELEDNSVDLFFTDPPYEKESLYLYSDLAKLAQAKLKPSGICLAYSGQSHLNQIFNLMSEHLDYWWTFAIFITGAELRIWNKKLWVRWKPVLAFTKRPSNGRLTDSWFCDYVQGSGKDKRFHKWGQSVQEAAYWIEALVPENGLVVDPFCGGGTIPLACKLLGRQWLATEIDRNMAMKARQRLEVNDTGCSNI